MKVILLENLAKIGSIGEIIDVKRGFARNYLISNKKALYASKENINQVEKIKTQLSKKDNERKQEAKKIAELTLKCLKESVPTEVPGIAFLSGGQTEKEAAKNLNEINKLNNTNFIMTYSYGRALQQSALKFWSKDINDINGTQKMFDHRAKMCSLAAQGKWTEEIENK